MIPESLLLYLQTAGELSRLLGVRFMPGSRANETPVGRSLARVGQLSNARRGEEAWWELLRLMLLAKSLSELEAEHPAVLRLLARRLLTDDVPTYLGARHEALTAASLTSKGIAFAYGLRGAPDFTFSFDGASVGLECTSAHIGTSIETVDLYVIEPSEPSEKDLSYKVASAIRQKGRKPYASADVVVSIDATNIHALSGSAEPMMNEAEVALEESGLGGALVFATIYDRDENPPSIEVNYTRRDASSISAPLRAFLDTHFPLGRRSIERHVTPLVP